MTAVRLSQTLLQRGRTGVWSPVVGDTETGHQPSRCLTYRSLTCRLSMSVTMSLVWPSAEAQGKVTGFVAGPATGHLLRTAACLVYSLGSCIEFSSAELSKVPTGSLRKGNGLNCCRCNILPCLSGAVVRATQNGRQSIPAKRCSS